MRLIGHCVQLITLLFVYASFSDAFVRQIFSSVSPIVFALITIVAVCLFFVFYTILLRITKLLRFSREDTITTTFCGSKKSLVHGSLFVLVLGIPETQKVIFLLPIMIYNSFQLLYLSWVAKRRSQGKSETPKDNSKR